MQLPAESALALVPPPSLQFLSCCVLGYAGRCATFGEGALEEHAASSIKVRAHACGSVAQVPPPRRRRSESIRVVGMTWSCLSYLFGSALACWRRTHLCSVPGVWVDPSSCCGCSVPRVRCHADPPARAAGCYHVLA
jgi:hypothetical protein